LLAYFTPGISREDTLVFGLDVQAYADVLVGRAPDPPALDSLPPLRTLPDSLVSDSTRHSNSSCSAPPSMGCSGLELAASTVAAHMMAILPKLSCRAGPR